VTETAAGACVFSRPRAGHTRSKRPVMQLASVGLAWKADFVGSGVNRIADTLIIDENTTRTVSFASARDEGHRVGSLANHWPEIAQLSV
jgi:hypothetical protein